MWKITGVVFGLAGLYTGAYMLLPGRSWPTQRKHITRSSELYALNSYDKSAIVWCRWSRKSMDLVHKKTNIWNTQWTLNRFILHEYNYCVTFDHFLGPPILFLFFDFFPCTFLQLLRYQYILGNLCVSFLSMCIPGKGGFSFLPGTSTFYRMARIRERKTRDIDQIKCIKDGTDRLLVKDEEIMDR